MGFLDGIEKIMGGKKMEPITNWVLTVNGVPVATCSEWEINTVKNDFKTKSVDTEDGIQEAIRRHKLKAAVVDNME